MLVKTRLKIKLCAYKRKIISQRRHFGLLPYFMLFDNQNIFIQNFLDQEITTNYDGKDLKYSKTILSNIKVPSYSISTIQEIK